jgi:hypothetical protein
MKRFLFASRSSCGNQYNYNLTLHISYSRSADRLVVKIESLVSDVRVPNGVLAHSYGM